MTDEEIAPIEPPEQVAWIDPIHRSPDAE